MSQKKTVLLNNQHGKIELENEVMIVTWKVTNVDLNAAKRGVENRLQVAGDKNYPMLVKIKSMRDSSKAARDYLASAEGSKCIAATAIYAESVLDKTVASLYVALNKPHVPTKVFRDEGKAKLWLKKYVNKK